MFFWVSYFGLGTKVTRQERRGKSQDTEAAGSGGSMEWAGFWYIGLQNQMEGRSWDVFVRSWVYSCQCKGLAQEPRIRLRWGGAGECWKEQKELTLIDTSHWIPAIFQLVHYNLQNKLVWEAWLLSHFVGTQLVNEQQDLNPVPSGYKAARGSPWHLLDTPVHILLSYEGGLRAGQGLNVPSGQQVLGTSAGGPGEVWSWLEKGPGLRRLKTIQNGLWESREEFSLLHSRFSSSSASSSGWPVGSRIHHLLCLLLEKLTHRS